MDVLGQPLFSLDPPYAHSPASSAGSSPAYTHTLLFPADESFFDAPYLPHTAHNPHPASALQIATGALPQHDPEEETAHPLRGPGILPPAPADAPQPPHDSATEDPADEDPADTPLADALALTRPLTHHERTLLAHLDRLKFFLATAPARWPAPAAGPQPALNRFLLPNAEYVSCVLWNGLYHITGTDIVRALVFRFEAFGRPVRNMKKFEEGVFSDLRNLKPGVDACLEEPKSPFLDLLFKYQCIRTQKKQKVFYWFSVPHDRLFLDALERDLKREKMGLESTTLVAGEPALSFTYDPKRALYEQFARPDDDAASTPASSSASASTASSDAGSGDEAGPSTRRAPNSAFLSMFSLFEGSPTYKQRRKKIHKRASPLPDEYPPAFAHHPSHPLSQSLPSHPSFPPFPSHASPFAAHQQMPQQHQHQHQHQHQLQMHEPPLQFDRFGRATPRLSAGALFAAQARGDLAGAGANPDLLVTQRERQRRALQRPPFLTGLPGAGRHHTFPTAGGGGYAGHRTNTVPQGVWQAQQGQAQGQAQTTRAWVCPLLSCGRMFARADALRAHVRVHGESGGGRAQSPDPADRSPGRADRAQPSSDAGAAPDAEGDAFDVALCEVEVQGPVRELPGEDGLVAAAAVVRPSSAGSASGGAASVGGGGGSGSAEGSPEQEARYPEFEMLGSAQASPVPFPAGALSASGSSVGGYGAGAEYVTSISAPSQRATFDHAALYPRELDAAHAGPGPIRRHRSATPSVPAHVRRPYSVAGTECGMGAGAFGSSGGGGGGAFGAGAGAFGGGGGGNSSGSPGRAAFHPYAAAAHAHSASAESSPMAYSAPLGYALHGARRPGAHSRQSSSSHLQEQMQMLGIEVGGMDFAQEQAAPSLHPQALHPQAQLQQSQLLQHPPQQVPFNGASGAFRTDSPMQFGGYELAMGGGHQQDQPMQGVYADVAPPQQFSQGYYAAYGEVPM